MGKNRKQQIIIGLIIFISVVLVISIAVLVNKKTDTSVNKEVTSLQPTKDQNLVSEPVTKEGVYGLESLDTTRLTTIQKTHFEVQLDAFIETYTGENLSFVTVDKETLKTSYNTARSANELRFNIISNSNTVYSVSGLYVSVNDMYVTIYDTSNTVVYFEPYDAGGE